jgi:hypothetical protein
MISPLLALFVRSLREDSRLKFTYFTRAAFVTVILFFLFSVQSDLGWANAPGLRFFETVVLVDLVFVILAGLSYFSSAISEEKEEMTLGLLRMTNLNPLSILLGKSTSRLCTAVLLFVAQLPFTLLAVTLGGISLRQIFAAYLTIAAFLVFVSNLALLASVLNRRTSGAALLTGLGLIFFFGVVPVAAWFAALPVRLGLLKADNSFANSLIGIAELAKDASPFERIGKILATGFRGEIFSFQAGSNLAMGLVFFLLSWAIFERFCGEEKENVLPRAGVARSRGNRRVPFSPGRPWGLALAWKDFYFTTGGKLWIFIKLLIYGTPLVVIRCWPSQLGGASTWEDFGFGAFWIMLVFIFVELSFAAANLFRNEHQAQTLSTLAMLPKSIACIAYEKMFGILPSLLAAGAYLAFSLPLVANSVQRQMGSTSGQEEFWMVFIFLTTQSLLFLHLVATLSLYVKRGALPLSIALQFLLYLFAMFVFSGPGRNDSAFFYGLSLFALMAVGFLHVHVGYRLQVLAAEE